MFRTTAALEPLQVATLPSPYPGSDVPNGSPDGPVTLESACLEPGELPDPVDLETSPGDADKYHGRCVWRFDADLGVPTSLLAEYRTAMLCMSTAGPRLYLLPDGELSLVGVAGYQTMETWLAG